MARIRTIKPEFWTSAQVLECSTNARLLFLGTWNFADDAGRHPWSPKQCKAEIFPADSFTDEQIEAWLIELETNNLICRYDVDGKQYFYITGWKHQRIDKPQSAKYPDPFSEHSTTIPRTFPPDTIGKDTIGKDNIRAVASATRPSSNEEFLEFLKVYPRRQGSNPKHPARKKFEAHVKSGVSPETIIAAARAYEVEQRKLGNIGTPYIAQAVTWLNQQRFEDYTQKNGTGPPTGLTPEQQAKWVRDQLEAERATNETANNSSGCVLERSEEIRGSPPEGGRSAGVVFDFPRNAEAH